jgi:hypothetical protein
MPVADSQPPGAAAQTCILDRSNAALHAAANRSQSHQQKIGLSLAIDRMVQQPAFRTSILIEIKPFARRVAY